MFSDGKVSDELWSFAMALRVAAFSDVQAPVLAPLFRPSSGDYQFPCRRRHRRGCWPLAVGCVLGCIAQGTRALARTH